MKGNFFWALYCYYCTSTLYIQIVLLWPGPDDLIITIRIQLIKLIKV